MEITEIDVKLPTPDKPSRASNKMWKEKLERIAQEAATQIQECRKPFEDAIAEKQERLQLLDEYSTVFSDNDIIHLKDLPLGSYNVMAMREKQTQFGEKFIMLIETDSNGTLGLCYSNKYIETYLYVLCENLTTEDKEQIHDPQEKVLNIV